MRILFAEDEEDMNRIVRQKLETAGYSVDSCLDGIEAIEYFDMAEYDIVILDIMMPGKDGLEVLKHIRNQGSTVPVLFLTARDSIRDKVEGLDRGANDYLVKPFSLEYLMHNKNIVVSREQIENHIWNYDYEGGTNVVDVYIRYLRKKIDDDFEQKLIHTIRGRGYVLKEQ